MNIIFSDSFFRSIAKTIVLLSLISTPIWWITNSVNENKLSAFFAAFAAVIALIQIYYNERRTISDNTHELLETFNSNEFRIARMNMHRHIKKAKMHGGYDALNENEKSQLSSIISLFSYAGILMKRNRIDKNLPPQQNLWVSFIEELII